MNINVVRSIRLVLYAKARYKILYGGRGSGKSWAIADYIIFKTAFGKFRVLCTREIQGSIKDSVYRLLCDRIYYHKLQHLFIVQRDSISSIFGSEIIFKGLRQNASEIKSTEGIDCCWIEEGEKVSVDSWDILIPTIRQEESEILVSFNPDDENSNTYTRFIEKDGKSIEQPGLLRAFVNYWDNPWFPNVLRREMEWCRQNDPEKYDHVWGGRPKKYGQAVIFKNKLRVEEFEPADPDTTQFYYGADFGFGSDPTCLVRLFIRDRKLYLDKEFYGYAIEIDDLTRCWDTVEGSRKWRIICDSARPDTISYMYNHGFQAEGAEKGPGSVEDGIEFLKNFEAIIIHPSCTGSVGDFSNYRWKVDKVTDQVLPIPVDKSNHACDAARYAMEPYMKAGVSIFDAMPRIG
jgi:phage terminase large subunit